MKHFYYGLLINLVIVFLYFQYTRAQDVVTDARIDNKELKCLVCKASTHELSLAIKKLDPTKTEKIGGHRLGADGSYDKAKTVPISKSEIHLSEVMEEICHKMDSYVRALWKTNGTLTILAMIAEDGTMNPLMSEVEFVQDEDLNKSLEYYCQSIIEEFEEGLIKLYQKEEENMVHEFCIKETNLCPEESPSSNAKAQHKQNNANDEL